MKIYRTNTKPKGISWRELRAACKKELAAALAVGTSITAVLDRYPMRPRDPALQVVAFAQTERGYQQWEKQSARWGITKAVRTAHTMEWVFQRAKP